MKLKSTNFSQMDEREFVDYCERAMNLIAARIGCDPEELLP